MQSYAYLDSGKNAVKGRYGKNIQWAGFWDVGKYLVMKQCLHIDELLEDHLKSGSLGINWYLFGPSRSSIYEPFNSDKVICVS